MEDIYKAEILLDNTDFNKYEIIKESGTKPQYFCNLLLKLKDKMDTSFLKTNAIKIQNDVISYLFKDNKLYLVISNKRKEIEISKKETLKTKKEENTKEIKKKKVDPGILKSTITNPLKQVYLIFLEILKILFKKIRSFYLQTFRFKLSRNSAKQILLDKNFDINVIENLLPEKKYITRKEMATNLAIFLKTKNHSKNLLENIEKYNKNFDKPFVISLIGTNGVGKSSTISKLLNLLTVNNKYNVTVIAGDTFRSGAIEQLQGYVCNFINNSSDKNGKIRFYSRGYVKDEVSMINYALNLFNKEYTTMKNGNPSNISKEQFSFSNFKEGTINNLIIIDTSGRQPTNDNLMNSLLKLHRTCSINKSYIVSEIITGQKNNILKFIAILKQVEVDLEVIFTKLDCTRSEIGMVFNILYESDVAIGFVCYGEKNTDISVFSENYILDVLEL